METLTITGTETLAVAMSQASASTSGAFGKIPKIYVVDDDAASRASLDSILRSVGYSVELFESGVDLLTHARSGLWGCIVLDVRLPGPSGLEVQRRLAEAGFNNPIVFITGHGDIAMAVQAMKARAVEFLTKPFREQDLLDAIAEAMDRACADLDQALTREKIERQIRSLTGREINVFRMLCQGLLGKQIAHELDISEATVKVHRRNVMQKLDVTNISQLVLKYGSFVPQASSDHSPCHDE